MGTGNLVNLISNDVAKFEEFSTFSPFFICGILELIAIMLILFFQLNIWAGLAAVGINVMFIPGDCRLTTV